MEKTTAKQTYEAPQLTAVSFKVEQGFAGSGPFSALIFWEQLIDEEQQQVEDYTTGNGWTSGSNHFWD